MLHVLWLYKQCQQRSETNVLQQADCVRFRHRAQSCWSQCSVLGWKWAHTLRLGVAVDNWLWEPPDSEPWIPLNFRTTDSKLWATCWPLRCPRCRSPERHGAAAQLHVSSAPVDMWILAHCLCFPEAGYTHLYYCLCVKGLHLPTAPDVPQKQAFIAIVCNIKQAWEANLIWSQRVTALHMWTKIRNPLKSSAATVYSKQRHIQLDLYTIIARSQSSAPRVRLSAIKWRPHGLVMVRLF